MNEKELSPHVKSMKFMSRVSEAQKRQELKEKQQQKQLDGKWVLENVGKPRVETDTSYLSFMDASWGRRSFRAFNKEIEALEEETVQVNDEQLANHYKRKYTLPETPNKKLKTDL